ncbi:caspase family protein [candidate division KSB1 bacterium]|nr:caspase family protein [candidate division KSB1 bacterium]
MAQKIYALQIGINDYDDEVGKLKGCVNDVHRFTDYLKSSFGEKNLAIERFFNEDATYKNVVGAFKNHLTKAKKGDVALVQYSGHGAQWASAPEFHEFFPDGRDEGLVLIDSRRAGGFDLADKELAVLLNDIAKNDPHLVLILDCCHSGSGTRGVDDFINRTARRSKHERDDVRPIESYLDGYYKKLKKTEWAIPTSPHMLLAACERTQQAWERKDNSGVFTSAMMDVLEKSGSNISYADLFVRSRHAVRRYADDQNPQFEAVGNFDAYSGFLGQDVSVQRRRYFIYYDTDKWVVDFGALHGAPTELDFAAMPATQKGTAQKAKHVEFAIYNKDDQSKKLGHATTKLIGTQRSELELDFEPSLRETYFGEITTLPVTPIPVLLEGEDEGVKILRKALDPQLGITLIDDPAQAAAAQYQLIAQKQQFLFKNCETGALIQGIDGYSEPNAKQLFGIVKQVVHWERTIKLQNHNTQLDQSAVDFQFFELLDDGKEFAYTGDAVTLDYVKSGNDWKKIRFKMKARNQTDEPLYFTLAYFSRKYGISILKNEPVQPAKSGEWVTLFGESPKHALGLRDDADESLDTFKLFVSRSQVDDFLLMQKEIKMGKILPTTRDLFGDDDEDEQGKHEDDWFTKTIRVQVVRQLEKVSNRDTAIAGGKIKIKAHPAMQADLSLTSARTGTRSAGGGSEIYRALERGAGMQLANLGGDDEAVLELNNIENDDALRRNPLELEMDIPLEADEEILPIVFDGEHFVLGGESMKDEHGTTHISIDNIPESSEPQNRRSVGKALKMYFFKTYLKHDDVNQLRWVEYHNDGSFERHKNGVKEKVSAAKKVLLLVHGIIGDTKNIATGIRMIEDKDGKTLDQHFDLVLTYDYENLSTPIEDTAAKLKEQLELTGLKDGDGKELTILAHSMGGLVSRWFVEQDGGNKVVDHLVLCGTPNNGSPFGKIDFSRKIISMLTTVALNTFPAFAPVGGVILAVMNRSKKVTPTLEQMNESSSFMKKLNTSSDPGIPYSILAGNINSYNEPSDQLFPKLIAKAGKGSVLETVFGTQAHDIAVNLSSIKSVDDARKPAPQKQEVGCHHLNYFSSEAGITALKTIFGA